MCHLQLVSAGNVSTTPLLPLPNNERDDFRNKVIAYRREVCFIKHISCVECRFGVWEVII